MEFNASAPIYLQIADQFKRLIVSGRWEKGGKAPPVRELALEMGVNPNTMQKAMALLEEEGLLHAERTSGRYVTADEAAIQRARDGMTVTEMEGFRDAMRGIGYRDSEILALFSKYINEG